MAANSEHACLRAYSGAAWRGQQWGMHACRPAVGHACLQASTMTLTVPVCVKAISPGATRLIVRL